MRSKKYRKGFGQRQIDVLQCFTQDQLAWIGAVALAYNDAEQALQVAFINSNDYPANTMELVTRLGVGQLPLFVLKAVKHYVKDKAVARMAERTLVGDGFTALKSYRDGVVHSRIFDSSTAIGKVPNKGKTDSVLLSEIAVEGLYHRLRFVREEIVELTTIVAFTRSLRWPDLHEPKRARHKEQYEQFIQAATDRLNRLQKQRKLLPPLPAFPQGYQQVGAAPQTEGVHLEPTIQISP